MIRRVWSSSSVSCHFGRGRQSRMWFTRLLLVGLGWVGLGWVGSRARSGRGTSWLCGPVIYEIAFHISSCLLL